MSLQLCEVQHFSALIICEILKDDDHILLCLWMKGADNLLILEMKVYWEPCLIKNIINIKNNVDISSNISSAKIETE